MVRFDAFSYALPCTERSESYFPNRIREGVFLHIDKIGIGEFAPLGGFHQLSVQDLLAQMRAIDFDHLMKDHETSTSTSVLRYVVSMAMFHRHLLEPYSPSARMLKLAALIEAADASRAITLAQNYLAQGYSHLKIKVGRIPIKDEIKKISTIAGMAGSKVKLRLDANRQMSFDDARAFLSGIKRVAIEYFEEPVADTHLFAHLKAEFGVDCAADESLAKIEDLDRLVLCGASHVIIKPSRFDSLFATESLVQKAQARGLKPIFSHCFESEFSSAIFALMIERLGLMDDAHGILVDGIFRCGVFMQPLRAFRGQLSLDHAHALLKTQFLQNPRVFTPVI